MSGGYLAAVTFDQLLADSPRQTREQWAARAAEEWRGRDAEHFRVHLGGGAEVPPFSSTARRAQPLSRPRRGPWVLLSDLRGLGGDFTRADALTELEGGAQGYFLDDAQLGSLRGAGADVRFDFLTVATAGGGEATEALLREVVPAEQWGGMRWLPVAASTADAQADTVAQAAALTERLARPAAGFAPGASPVVEVAIPSDYLAAVALLGALDVLWANVAAEAFPEVTVVPPLTTVAAVGPTAATSTPEAYFVDASVRAVAAASAGVDAICVAPYSTAPEHRRRARNLLHLLQLEAGLAGGTDALAGAAWFEEASLAVARAAWDARDLA